MSTEIQNLSERLDQAIDRIQKLENRWAEEGNASPWRFLVSRPHPWRKQLSIKGRNTTVGQLVAALEANHLTVEQAADEFALPIEAVREALAYFEENRRLIGIEALEERRRLAERGHALEPGDLSR